MKILHRALTIVAVVLSMAAGFYGNGEAQERVKLDYSSVDTSNAVWYAAQEGGFFKKHGLDSQLIYIPSTTTAVASIIAGDVSVGNASGGGVASASGGGGIVVMVACFLSTLPWEVVVEDNSKLAADLNGSE